MLESLSRRLAVTAALTVLLAAGGAGAQAIATASESIAMEAVTRHHEAVQAAMMCESRRFTMDQVVRLAEMIAPQAVALPTGSELKTLNDARDLLRARISSLGCDEAMVRDRLAYFRGSIAPTIGS